MLVGEHAPECLGGSCRGCLPAPALVGVMCSSCWARLRAVLRTLGSVVDQALVHADLPGGRSPSDSSGVGGRVAGPGVLYPEARAAADELAQVVWSWCDMVAEALGVESPRPVGLWWSTRSTKADPISGEPYVCDPVVVGVKDRLGIVALAQWLDGRLEQVGGFEWVGEMLSDIGRVSARIEARWGVEEDVRRVRDVRCPTCQAMSLVVHPPRVVGAELQVVCSRVQCDLVLTQAEWEQLRARALVVARLTGGQAVGA